MAYSSCSRTRIDPCNGKEGHKVDGWTKGRTMPRQNEAKHGVRFSLLAPHTVLELVLRNTEHGDRARTLSEDACRFSKTCIQNLMRVAKDEPRLVGSPPGGVNFCGAINQWCFQTRAVSYIVAAYK